MTEQTTLLQSDDEKRAEEFARELGIAKNFLLKATLKNAGLLSKQLDSKSTLSPATHKIIQSTLLDASRTVAQAEALMSEKSGGAMEVIVHNAPTIKDV